MNSRFAFMGAKLGLLRALMAVAVLHGGALASFAAAPVDYSKLPPAAARRVDFDRDIQPLFEASCLKCHGPEKQKSGFRLDQPEDALAGGDNGKDILPGDSAKSPLIHYVAHLAGDFEMPPKGKGEPLTSEQVGLLRAWIDQGAKWPGGSAAADEKKSTDKTNWWSLKPLTRPVVPPAMIPGAWIANPIDAFVVAKLAENKLNQSPDADSPALLRPHWPAAQAGGDRGVRRGRASPGLRKTRGSVAGIAALWGALGATLVGCGALRRDSRL